MNQVFISSPGHHNTAKVLTRQNNQQNDALRFTRVMHTGDARDAENEQICQTSQDRHFLAA
jgi:hypothetical protein